MALSGAYEDVLTRSGTGGWKLRLEWYATQDKRANTSKVTAKLYWISFGNGYSVRSTASKTCNININGNVGSKTQSGLAALGYNHKKLIHTHTRTIKHDSLGRATFTLGAKFWCKVTLFWSSSSRQYVDSFEIPTKTITLDTIPLRIKRYDGSTWIPAARVRRYDGNVWKDATIRKRYDGSKWIDV